VAAAVIAVVGFLFTRVLLSMDRNQSNLAENIKNLWEHHDELSKDFYQMKGAHDVNHGRRVTDVQGKGDDE
jgi:hypothetical protein